MARMRAHVPKWDSSRYGEFKDMRRGATEDAFWNEDEPVEFRTKSNKRAHKHKGCPGNDGNEHVYVWEKRYHYNWYSKKWYVWEVKLCCGCEKRGRGFRSLPDIN